MRNVSSAFKEALKNDQREYIEYADFTLENGTTLNLTNSDFWQNGFSYEDSVSPNNNFQVGSAVINKVNLIINNIYGDFDEYDFFGAVAIIGVGLEINGVVERVNFGEFTVVDQPDYNGSLISIELYDNMFKFDKPYSDSRLVYPASLDTIIRDACTNCNVLLKTTDFPNKNFVVSERPDDEKLTFREVVAYAAQVAGCYARIETSAEGYGGQLALRWFGTLMPKPTVNIPSSLFNTISGMTAVFENTRKDDSTASITGVDWFSFGGKVASTIYVNSNSWIVFGGTSPSSSSSSYSADIGIYQRDGQQLSLYTQEGTISGFRFYKIRFEGYTRYSTTYQTDEYRLVYELFLLSTGDMVLNVIRIPTNTSYLGTSKIIDNGVTTTLTLGVGTYHLYSDNNGWHQGNYSPNPSAVIIDSIYNHRVSTDNVVITGIKVSMDVEHEIPVTEGGTSHTETVYEKAEYLEGTDGYVIAIENNPLIAESQIQTVAEYLGGRIIGFAFRTASATHGSDPTIEAGDVGYLINGKGQTYPIVISKTKFSVGSAQNTESVAEEPIRNTAARFSVEAQNYVKARKRIAAEKTQRQLIEDEINARIDNAGGLYETEVQQQGGGVITYLHNLPVLAESDIQIMVSSVGVMVTANGTAQQPAWYGLTVDGTLLANILSVYGISADWIHTGTLTVGGDGNAHGVIRVLDASDNQTSILNKDGISSKSLVADDYIYLDASDLSGSYISIPFKNDGGTITYRGRVELSDFYGFFLESAGRTSSEKDRFYFAPLHAGYYGLVFDGHTGNKTEIGAGDFTIWNSSDDMPQWLDTGGFHFYANGSRGGEIYLTSYGDIICEPEVEIRADFTVTGTKSRIVETQEYSKRYLYCYETPSPYFGDIGDGTISEDGYCYITIDPIFSRTVTLDNYQVFVQRYGEGDCFVYQKTAGYFVVKGTPGLKFGWEMKAKQCDYDQLRLGNDIRFNSTAEDDTVDYAEELIMHINDIHNQREVSE